MSCRTPSHRSVLVWLIALLLGALPAQAAVSVNFKSDPNAVGAETAGYFPAANWNDVLSGVITDQVLIDDLGGPSGLSISIANHAITDAGGVNFGAPATAGDNAMMKGHIYEGGFQPVDLTFTGAVPYANYDLIVYYNSSAVTNQQSFSILDGNLQPLPGLSKLAFEVAGGDVSYKESDGVLNGNYVRFKDLTAASIPTNFVIRAQGASGQYSYFNGLQFAEAGRPTLDTPPPPTDSKIPAISINIKSNPYEVGTSVAGVLPATHWNDIVGSTSPAVPGGAVVDQPLVDNKGVATGVTISVADHLAYDAGGVTIGGAGDSAMMTGHMYSQGGAPLDIRVDGAIQFENYDLYVYYNSSNVSNTQKFSLLFSGDLADTGISLTAFESPGPDAEYLLGDVGINGNFVKFSALNNIDLPSFVLRAQGLGGADQFGYVNGLQIVKIILGDADSNGTVDFTDLGILLNNYNLPGVYSNGDFDKSGTVDFTDLGILLNNYNQTVELSASLPLGATAPVPEPSTLALAAVGLAGLLFGKRRHVHRQR